MLIWDVSDGDGDIRLLGHAIFPLLCDLVIAMAAGEVVQLIL